MNPFIIVGGLIAIVYLLKGGAAKNLQLLIKGVNMSSGKLYVSIQVLNPSSSGITLNSFVGDLVKDGNSVGKLTFFGPISIAPNNGTTIPVLVSLNPLGLISEISEVFNGGISLKGYTIAATISAEGVSFNQSFTIS